MVFMPEGYFLGVDVGGTKTHALVADGQGKALGFAEAGPGNHQSVGYDGLAKVLEVVVRRALRMAGLSIGQVTGAGFGIGGFDWPSQLDQHQKALTPLGLRCPVDMVNDSMIALLAGASQGWGVVLIAGTGNNCRGRDQFGRQARITGEGGRFGEFGGAGDLVEKAVQAVAYEWTGRGSQTSLTGLFLAKTGAKNLDMLIEGIDQGCYQPDASWAPILFDAAQGGDRVALEVIAWSGGELGESACAVIRRLEIESLEFDVILAGSVFEGGELYIEPLRSTIQPKAPKARLVKLETPPVAGGVILGMQKAGLDTVPIHRTLITSTSRLLSSR